MKGITKAIVLSSIFCLTLMGMPFAALSQDLPHPKTYIPTINDIEKHKKFYDDPRPYLTTFGPKQVVPKAVYEKLAFSPEEMKKAWADVVGFKAPDVVGKIAPEIKPGKYTYKDVQNNPAFKQLMYPDLYNRIKQGGPPMVGSIAEFEIIPTRQYYWSLPVAEATKKNEGKTKLDDRGYLVASSWEGGYPYPKPAGKFKAQQVMYNVEKRYLSYGLDFYLIGRVLGFTKNLKMDFDGAYEVKHCRLAGRVQPPLGWFDNRAKERGEAKTFVMDFPAPRDVAGTAQSALYYLDPEKADQLMVYVPSMRRVRKMTATDTQDPIMGMDQIYDDNEGWMQKLSPTRYPYKFEIVEEREFLVTAPTLDGAEYIAKSTMEFKNVKLERRPMYVVKLTQLDANYVYKYRIFYVDRETFNYYHVANYDRKERLYRTWDGNYSFFADLGTFTWAGSFILMRDHIDVHSSVEQPYMLPAQWTRPDLSLEGFMKAK